MTALEEYEKHRASAELTPLSAGIAALADAAIESLKCCGNCVSQTDENMFLGLHLCRHLDFVGNLRRVRASDHCHFTPSRWQECER